MVITKMSFPSAAFNADGAAEQRNLWLRLHCSEDECDFGPLSLASVTSVSKPAAICVDVGQTLTVPEIERPRRR